MRADALVWLVHAIVIWVLVRTVASLAVSAGAQSLWALAAAAGATVFAATLLTAWLTRTVRTPTGRQVARLLPVPLVGAVWTGVSVVAHGGHLAQVLVAGAAWLVGAALALLAISVTRRARPREDAPFHQFVAGDG